MDVKQNFHVPILCTGDTKAISDENQFCEEDVRIVSGDSKSMKILEEFKRIYLERLRKIEEETPEEGAELKLKTLTSWINDLGEQNLMLVETVEQLEQEAADRVLLLEERLKKSSHIALEYLSKLEEYDNQLLNQSLEKVQPMVLPIKTSNRFMQAQQTEEILKTRISNLQNDISGLLELIRRAHYDGSWDTSGLSFLEVTYEDIFGLYPHQVTNKLETTDHLQTTISALQQKLERAVEDNLLKDQEIKLLRENLASRRVDETNLANKSEEFQSTSCRNPKEKKGVSFVSPTKEDYKPPVQDFQTTLKQPQNEVELGRKQVTQHCGCQKEKVVLAKQIEECRLNVVLAQAAIEETVEELETVADILHAREEKIKELEAEIQCLQSSLIHSQQDIQILLQPINCDTSQRCLQINNFEDKLQMLSLAMKDSQKNIEDYRESQLRVIENLQDEIKELSTVNKLLQRDSKKCTFCNLLNDNNCNIPIFIEKLREEIENLKSTISANENVILHQREMLNIQQEALVMSQDEVKELQTQLKNLNEDLGRTFREEKMEEKMILNISSGKQQTHNIMREININMSGATTYFEKTENEAEEMCTRNKNLKEIESVKQLNFKYETSNLFINNHLNELRTLLNAYSLQEREQGHLNSDLPMSYSKAITYCDYIEHEINKLQDLLVDFQLQTSTFKSEVRRPIDNSVSLMKIANLEMILSETCENYETAKRDCSKYQEQLVNAAEREVIQQENFTAEETYWLEKVCQAQAENLRYLDIVNILNEEIELLHQELHERDCQLQNTASTLRVISSQSSALQHELQKQEKNVEELEDLLLSNNIKLQKALSYLDLKNKLVQNPNNEGSRMKDNCWMLRRK